MPVWSLVFLSHTLLHAICELVEKAFVSGEKPHHGGH